MKCEAVGALESPPSPPPALCFAARCARAPGDAGGKCGRRDSQAKTKPRASLCRQLAERECRERVETTTKQHTAPSGGQKKKNLESVQFSTQISAQKLSNLHTLRCVSSALFMLRDVVCGAAPTRTRRRPPPPPPAPLAEQPVPAADLDGLKLVAWLASLGFDDRGLRLCREDDGFGLRAVATAPIPRRRVVVSVPRAAWLTPREAAACPLVGRACRELSPFAALALKLLFERSRGGASFYAPYLATLPRQPSSDNDACSFSLPLLWPDGFAAPLLNGSLLASRLQWRRDNAAADHAAICSALEAAGVQHAVLPPPPSGDVRWAAAVLSSRAFRLESDDTPEGTVLALLPFADALNHAPSAGGEAEARASPGGDAAVIRAHKPYAIGEQVFDSYGNGLSRCDTLLDYGFVDGSAEADAMATIDRADLPASRLGPVAAPNAALLAAAGLPCDPGPFCAVAAMGAAGPDDGLVAWARVAVATRGELEAAGWSWTHTHTRQGDAARSNGTVSGGGGATGESGAAEARAALGRFVGGPRCAAGGATRAGALRRIAAAIDVQLGAYPRSAEADADAARTAEEGAEAASGGGAGGGGGARGADTERLRATCAALRGVLSERRALRGAAAAVTRALAAEEGGG